MDILTLLLLALALFCGVGGLYRSRGASLEAWGVLALALALLLPALAQLTA
jgi:hypothetical protein